MMMVVKEYPNTRFSVVTKESFWRFYAPQIFYFFGSTLMCSITYVAYMSKTPRYIWLSVAVFSMLLFLLAVWPVLGWLVRTGKRVWSGGARKRHPMTWLVFSVPFAVFAALAAQGGDHKASLIYGGCGAFFLLPTILAMLGWLWCVFREARPLRCELPTTQELMWAGGVCAVFSAVTAPYLYRSGPRVIAVFITVIGVAGLLLFGWYCACWIWNALVIAKKRFDRWFYGLSSTAGGMLLGLCLVAILVASAGVIYWCGGPIEAIRACLMLSGILFLIGVVAAIAESRPGKALLAWKPSKAAVVLAVSLVVVVIWVILFATETLEVYASAGGITYFALLAVLASKGRGEERPQRRHHQSKRKRRS